MSWGGELGLVIDSGGAVLHHLTLQNAKALAAAHDAFVNHAMPRDKSRMRSE